MTARAVTLLEFNGHFLVQNGTLMYINASYTIFVTCTHRSMPIQGGFLQDFAIFSLCPKETTDMSTDHNMSCHLAWSGRQNLTTCQADIPDIFPKC